MRPKKGTRKKQGHRQFYSRILIESIELDGKTILKAEEKKSVETVVDAEVLKEEKKAETKAKPKKEEKIKVAEKKPTETKAEQKSKKIII